MKTLTQKTNQLLKQTWRAAALAVLSGLAVSAPAQTLLYQWGFDNATGSGTTLTAPPSYIDGSMTGGVLTNFNNGGGVSGLTAPSGSGLTGGASDLGLVN